MAREVSARAGSVLVIRDSWTDDFIAVTAVEGAILTAGLDGIRSRPQVGWKRRRKGLKRLDSGMKLASRYTPVILSRPLPQAGALE
jgi:hypothetical protein